MKNLFDFYKIFGDFASVKHGWLIMKKLFNVILLSLFLISPIFSQTPANNDGQIFGRKLVANIYANNLMYTQALPTSSLDDSWYRSLMMKDHGELFLTISYQDGFVFGGEINGEFNVQSMRYRSTFQPGKILSEGIADDPNKNSYQLYKIKNDWQKLPFGLTKDRYGFDYANWPGQDGAPFFDLDRNGIFSKNIDKPNPLGDEAIWFVGNALKNAETFDDFEYPYSKPSAIELHKTIYAFKNFNVLRDVVFIKYLFINKNSYTLKDFYFSQWNDADIGYPEDDFVCCLPELNLGIAFNADSLDEKYFGKTPPALGLLLLQGPKIEGNATDSAMFLGKWITGYKNLGSTSFNIPYIPFGIEEYDYNHDLADLNAIKGLNYYYGNPIINPITHDTTKFVFEGNPGEKSGWFAMDTLYKRYLPRDFQIYLSSGPFTMAPGDSQEVAVAFILGQGADNLKSVTDVIEKAKVVQYFYNNYDAYATSETYKAPVPEYYSLSQNYPNPFNPLTKIDYELPADGLVTLEVFNVVGEKVATLVSELKTKGNHSITFDAAGLPSGIYFYSISSLNYFKTKKMILIK